MSVVHEGWLKKSPPPKKIAGIRIKRMAQLKYFILKNNGDLWMLDDQPMADDDVYNAAGTLSRASSRSASPYHRRSSNTSQASSSRQPSRAQSVSSQSGSPVHRRSSASPTTRRPSDLNSSLEQRTTTGSSVSEGEMHLQAPNSMSMRHERNLSFPNSNSKPLSLEIGIPSIGGAPSGGIHFTSPPIFEAESGDDTDPDTPESQTPRGDTGPSKRSRSPLVDSISGVFRNSLSNLKARKSSSVSSSAAARTLIRLARSVVSGLTENRISLCVNDFQKLYVLEAEGVEQKTQWIEALQRVCAQHAVSLDDFEVLKCVGSGGFGKVYKVRMRHNERVYAMKVMDKGFLVGKGAIEEVMNEVTLMQGLSHPYIARLYSSFQTGDKLCMLMDFLAGGELFTLTQRTLFPEEVMKLHAAEMALAIDYLHEQDIIYRDLKPENIVLDNQAHCMLTDFGLAHRIGEERLDALAGSPTYMAPELLNYPPKVTKAVDWWALGCMMFEVTTGRHPFMNEEDEVVLDLVTTADPQLDDTQGIAISDDLKDLVRRFLIKEPEERLQSLEEIKQHPFFQDIDWAAVMDREVQPMYRGLPWKPRVAEKDKFDADAVAQGTQIEKNKDLVQDDAKHHFDGFDWTSNSILRDTSLSVAAQVEIDKGLR